MFAQGSASVTLWYRHAHREVGAEPVRVRVGLRHTNQTRRDAPMAASHAVTTNATSHGALARLQSFLAERRRTREPTDDLERFERELHAMFAAVECEALAEELAKFDVDVPVVEVEGVAHRRVLRCEETYF